MSTVTWIDDGSTPAPVSVATIRTGCVPVTLRVTSRSFGGVTSLIQKRNVNAPGLPPDGVSNTTSYAPGVGRTAPTTGSARSKFEYGLRSTGSPVFPSNRFSSPATTIRGITLEPLAWSTTATPKFATGLLIRTR